MLVLSILVYDMILLRNHGADTGFATLDPLAILGKIGYNGYPWT
jgi:hypothetical protein